MKFARLFLLFVALSSPIFAQAQPEPQIIAPLAEPAAPAPGGATVPEPEFTVRGKKNPDARDHHFHDDTPVIFFKKFVLHTNETASEVVVIGGDAEIDGTIDRGLTVVGGSAQINGSIGRDVVVVGGGATIGPKANIHGRHSVFVGGPFNLDPKANLNPHNTQVELGDWAGIMKWSQPWLMHGLFWGRLLTVDSPWPWAVAGSFLVFYGLLLALFPKAVSSIVETLKTRPVASLSAGLLGFILWGPLMALIAVTIVGIPLLPFFPVALALLVLFGKTGFLCFVGQNMTSAGKEGPCFFALLAGSLVLSIAYLVPLLGLLVFFVTTMLGFGAAIIAVRTTLKGNSPISDLNLVPVEMKPAGKSAPEVPPIISGAQNNPVALPLVATPPLPPSPPSPPASGEPEILFLRRAGFWNRLAAALLDIILLTPLVLFMHQFFIIAAIIYFVGMWTWRGTTIGSIVLGLKIVRTNGTPINFIIALVRSLSCLFSAVVLFLGFLWIGWDRDKQGWHDKIAGTTVVRMPKGVALI